jgi:hypothetical protein
VLAHYGWADAAAGAARARGRPADDAPAAPAKPERWTAEKRQAFKLFAPRALYIAAPDVMLWLTTQPVGGGEVKAYGGNRGFRPVKISSMKSWRDTVSRLHDVIPYVRYGKPRRLWFHRNAELDQVGRAAAELIESGAEDGAYEVKVGPGLLNLGPDIDFDQLIRDLHEVARRQHVLCWDDQGLSLFIDRALVAARQKGIVIVDRRGRGSHHPGFVKMLDRMVEHEWHKQFSQRSSASL